MMKTKRGKAYVDGHLAAADVILQALKQRLQPALDPRPLAKVIEEITEATLAIARARDWLAAVKAK